MGRGPLAGPIVCFPIPGPGEAPGGGAELGPPHPSPPSLSLGRAQVPTRTLVQIRTHAQKYFLKHPLPTPHPAHRPMGLAAEGDDATGGLDAGDGEYEALSPYMAREHSEGGGERGGGGGKALESSTLLLTRTCPCSDGGVQAGGNDPARDAVAGAYAG
jgi:hypothetical protein